MIISTLTPLLCEDHRDTHVETSGNIWVQDNCANSIKNNSLEQDFLSFLPTMPFHQELFTQPLGSMYIK